VNRALLEVGDTLSRTEEASEIAVEYRWSQSLETSSASVIVAFLRSLGFGYSGVASLHTVIGSFVSPRVLSHTLALRGSLRVVIRSPRSSGVSVFEGWVLFRGVQFDLGKGWFGVSLYGDPTRCLTAGRMASAVRVYDSGWDWEF